MFRKMRRQDRELSKQAAWEIVKNNKYGVLSLIGDNGYPYGVPMHYIIIDDTLYMHGTNDKTHRTDSIKNNPKMSFTIMEMESDIKGRSVIAFGKVMVVKGMTETILSKLIETYVPGVALEQAKGGIQFAKSKVEIYKLDIEHLTAKKIDQPDNK